MMEQLFSHLEKTKLDPYNKSFTQIPKDQRLK